MSRMKDLVGQQFGRLKVLRLSDRRSPSGSPLWECRCSCPAGSTVYARTDSLTTGNTKSCGCVNKEKLSAAHSVDLTGRQFGRLTVLCRADVTASNGHSKWICRCSCPEQNIVTVTVDHLTSGHTKSCGCLHRDIFTKWKSPDEERAASILNGMKQRCYNPNNKRYEVYGGRGIKICNEWLNDTRSFVDWAMTHGYYPGSSIDRINNDGSYTPDNCRWVDNLVQANNKSTNRLVEIDGLTRTMSEWSDISEIPRDRLQYLLETDFTKFMNAIIDSPAYAAYIDERK